MKKYICRILFYLSVGIIMVAALDWISALTYNFNSMMMYEMYQNTKNIDTLFMGSSHVYRSYDSKLADEMLGEETFNLGSSSQTLITTYYLLKEAGNNNKINTVYLDTFWGIYGTEISPDDDSIYSISDYMQGFENKMEFLWNAGGIRGLENGLIYRYNRRIGNADIIGRLHLEKYVVGDYSKVNSAFDEYRGKGFVYAERHIENEIEFQKEVEDWNSAKELLISSDSYEYLMKIIEYCRENSINLVLVDSPMSDELLSGMVDYNNYVDFFQKLANQYGIVYMNFNLCKDYDRTINDFYDPHHLNGEGAEKYTRIFCNTVNALKNQEKSMDDLFYPTYIPNRVE